MDRINHKLAQLRELMGDRGQNAASSLTIAHVMTLEPTCVAPDMPLVELIKLFHGMQVRHFLVTAPNGELLGVISDRDVLRCFGADNDTSNDRFREMRAESLMSVDLVTASRDTSIRDALRTMIDFGISCLPIVEDVEPVGILTSTDLQLLLEYFLETSNSSHLSDFAMNTDGRQQTPPSFGFQSV